MESREIVQTFIDASWRSMPRDAGRTVMGNQAARLCRQPASQLPPIAIFRKEQRGSLYFSASPGGQQFLSETGGNDEVVTYSC